MEIPIDTGDFYNLMIQLYPDQSARVIAEIKAMKLEEMVNTLMEQSKSETEEKNSGDSKRPGYSKSK